MINNFLFINNIKIIYSIIEYRSFPLKDSLWSIKFFYKNKEYDLDINFSRSPVQFSLTIFKPSSISDMSIGYEIIKTNSIINLIDAVSILDNLIFI